MKKLERKKHLRKSTMLKRSEYQAIVGLLTLAGQHTRSLRDIETALLDITKECDYDGKLYQPWGGGHVTDAVNSTNPDPEELLRKIGLKVTR